MIGYGAPLAPEARVNLAEVLIILPEDGQTAWLSVHPINEPSLLDPPGFGYPVCHPAYSYGSDHTFVPMLPVSGCESIPLAVINSDGQPPQMVMDELPDQLVVEILPWNGEPVQYLSLHNQGPISYTGQVRAVGATPVLIRIGQNYLSEDPLSFQVPVGGNISIAADFPNSHFTESAIELEVCGRVWSVPVQTPCQWSPDIVDFGLIPVEAVASQNITLTNTGVRNFQPPEELLAGPFRLSETSSTYYLYPGQSHGYTVYFNPDAVGEFEEVVVAQPSYCTVTLRGSAYELPPQCEVNVEQLIFPETMVNTGGSNLSFAMSNVGGGLVEGVATISDPSGAFHFSDQQNSLSYSLSYQQTTYIPLYFDPPTAGVFQAQVDLGPGCDSITVSGSAIDPGPLCDVEGHHLQDGVWNLDPVVVGEARYEYIWIRNVGVGLLEGQPSQTDTTGTFVFYQDPSYSLNYLDYQIIYLKYTPQTVGPDTTYVDLDSECGTITVVSNGLEPYPDCYAYPYRTSIGRLPVGSSTYSYFFLRNTGYIELEGNLDIAGEGFQLVNPGPFTLPIHSYKYDLLQFAPPDIGDYSAVVTTGLEPCPGDWTYTGQGVPTGSDRMGFYIDADGANNHLSTTAPAETATIYLVLHQPSAEGPLSHWYVNYWRSGSAHVLDDWVSPVPGNLRGYSYYHRFTPEVPMPLAQDMVLASFTVRVEDPLVASMIRIGYGYYTFVADGQYSYIPMYNPDNLFINGSKSFFADLPAPPVVEPGQDGVKLSWPAALMDLEGFHVYRRLLDGPPEKLTEEPVLAEDGEASFLDTTLPPGEIQAYYYLTALHLGEESLPGEESTLKIVEIVPTAPPPARTKFLANYPNPFNPETRLPFELAQPGQVRIHIYDLAGHLVRLLTDEHFEAGRFEVIWNGRDDAGRALPSNVYYAKLEADSVVVMQKMTLLK